jgi:signal transduction histidine kinase
MAEPVSFMNSALNNILTNAIKFSFPGGVITIAARNLGAAVELSVTDRGIGMSEKLLADLFDISKQTSRNGTSGEKGTGFGMPLLKKFVSLYGGAVEIESKDIKKYPEGHGTKVTLRLAAAQAE